MDIWIVSQISNFWQLWIMPLQTVTYKYLSPILLGRYLGMEWLDHVIILGFFTEKYQIIFYNGCTILYSQQQCMRIIQLLYNRIQFSSVAQSCLTLCNPWTVAQQAPLFMGFSREEYWNGLPFLPPGNLPNPGIKLVSPVSPALAGGFFTTSSTWKALFNEDYRKKKKKNLILFVFILMEKRQCTHVGVQ